jgi:hypothetical protein
MVPRRFQIENTKLINEIRDLKTILGEKG